MIAALFVEHGGSYFGLDGVEPWALPERDARNYHGPYPVVAHPPCARWCRLAGLVEARWGHKKHEDEGLFAIALNAVRTWGGVLEHPAFSDAWKAYAINAPPTGGEWVSADRFGGVTCYVEQGKYGHRAKKATWLYSMGLDRAPLRFGHESDQASEALVSWCGNRTFRFSDRPRLGKKEANATPEAFRNALIGLARTARLDPSETSRHGQ